jgi:hypothetical protein
MVPPDLTGELVDVIDLLDGAAGEARAWFA